MAKLGLGLIALLAAGCWPTDEDEGADAGSEESADAGVVPEFQLEVNATLTWAASATVGEDSQKDPDQVVEVDDIQPVVYTATKSSGGATADSRVEIQRSGHSVVFLGSASATGTTRVPAAAVAEVHLDGICVQARGAKGYRVTFTCEGTRTGSGWAVVVGINANEGSIPLCNTSLVIDQGVVTEDKDWDQTSDVTDVGVSATGSRECWAENADLVVLAGGSDISSDPGGGTASAEAKITMTVDPIY